MSRLDKFIEASAVVLGDRLSNNLNDMLNEIEKNQDKIILNLQNSIQVAIDKAVALQKTGQKENIKYISFSILLSSFLTQRYSFGINLFDETLFLDEVDAFAEWELGYVFKYIESDIKIARKELEKEFIRITDGEMLELKNTQALGYVLIYAEILKKLIPLALENVKTSDFLYHKEIEITFGLHMEKQVSIYTWEVL